MHTFVHQTEFLQYTIFADNFQFLTFAISLDFLIRSQRYNFISHRISRNSSNVLFSFFFEICYRSRFSSKCFSTNGWYFRRTYCHSLKFDRRAESNSLFHISFPLLFIAAFFLVLAYIITFRIFCRQVDIKMSVRGNCKYENESESGV